MKFPELRDTINTSNDIELLQACRAEFHRRLRVYHQWKERSNQKPTNGSVEQRGPDILFANAEYADIMQQSVPQKMQNGHQKVQNGAPSQIQRYFRVPFARSGDQFRPGNESKKTGWWYAHFDGQYIARQMELHPDKTPVLLLSGRDDMQMCELSLEESGLARKRGAEIVAHDFETEWRKHNGPIYVPNSAKTSRQQPLAARRPLAS